MMNRIGMDIGGTQLRVAAFGEDNHLVARESVLNDHSRGPRENLGGLLDIVDSWGMDYEGIGIGCPGPLDFGTGRLLNPPNLPGWEGFGVKDFVEGHTDHRVMVNNDANVAGLAEALVGAGTGYESVFYFTVSTGVGGAYVYRGKIVSGAHSCAAEVFDLMVNECSDHRPGMNDGCLEDQVSGNGMARIASRRLGRKVDGAMLFELAHAGDEVATDVVERGSDALARGVANVSFVVDPDVFVFGGSVSLNNPDFIDMVYEKARSYVLNPDELVFGLASCGDDAGLLGASLLV